MMNTQRLDKILKKMETEGLDQMIISDPYAIYYLTGRFIDPVHPLFHPRESLEDIRNKGYEEVY